MINSRMEWAETESESLRDQDFDRLINEIDVSHIEAFFEEMVGPHLEQSTLQFVSTPEQESFVIHQGSESAVFLDLSHVAVLRRLLASVAPEADRSETLEIIIDACSNVIREMDPKASSWISDYQFDKEKPYDSFPPDEIVPHLTASIDLYNAFYPNTLHSILSTIPELFILGHEIHHIYEHQSGGTYKVLGALGETAFDHAVALHCTQDTPEFREYWIAMGADDVAIEVIASDLEKRSKSWQENRDLHTKEIVCDLYSSYALVYTFLFQDEDEKPFDKVIKDYSIVAQSIFLVWALYDLHQAMVKRTRHVVDGGSLKEKPEFVADLHMRKVALAEGLQLLFSEIALRSPEAGDIPKEISQAVEKQVQETLTPALFAIKLYLDTFYVGPIASIITDCLNELRR